MKSFRSLLWRVHSCAPRLSWWVAAGLLLCAAALHGELAEWVQHLAVESGLRGVFFRPMPLPWGMVDGRRPPRETIPALAERIAASPKQAALYRLRAGEAELELDFAAAEGDWKSFAQLAGDPIALADFYHRRLRPADEIQALDRAGTPAAFRRAIEVAGAQGMPQSAIIAQYRAWIARFPDDAALHKQLIRYLVDIGQFPPAEREIAAYRQAFPKDESIWVEEAGLTMKRDPNQALAVFDKQFRPLMQPNWLKGFFNLLEGQGKLRDFLAQARAAAQAQPENLDPAARLFHYWRAQGNLAEARRALLEYRGRKKNWSADELYTTARLFEMVQEYDEAARQYYALYSLPGSGATAQEQGLAGLAGVLLTAPEQPVRFGSGDLSLYKDIATMDRHPGFLNGILSLVLNTAQPRWQYDGQNSRSVAYFHRGRASELLDLLDAKFPQSADAPALHSRLIEAYLTYGDNATVVRAGQRFLTAYRHAPERTEVALWMADAYARMDQSGDEFALYRQLLGELATRAGGVPLGDKLRAPEPRVEPAAGETEAPMFRQPQVQAPSPVRSLEYERVLDRYVARLVSSQRIADALALYATEIARNPNDPGLYEKLAAFLDQNHLGDEVERVYKAAGERFPNRSWQERLARWYLRQRRNSDFAVLTRQVVKLFQGTELERYFGSVMPSQGVDAALYLQLNLYAHERFPDDLVFVKNLLGAYSRKETADPAAHNKLLRSYWFYDDGLRARLFESLARASQLDTGLTAARNADAAANPAAAQFYAEGEAWRGHFESAAPVMHALATQFPGSQDIGLRAANIERSLGNTGAAVTLARNLTLEAPRDGESLARVGDILADRELFTRARPYWDRMAQIEPRKPAGYLEAATVFWDYYKYDDALRLIREGRSRLKDPKLFAYETGAIYEGKRDFPNAIREYVKGAAENSPAEARLLVLARRPARRPMVDQLTASGPLRLRAAVLETEKRTRDLEALLRSAAAKETSAGTLVWVERSAARLGFAGVEQLSLERQAALTRDAVDRLRLRLGLVRLHERHGEKAAAERAMDALLRENPAILGVVRAATDFYWRNGMSDRAIQTLAGAAAVANAEYRKQFTYEAARKATDVRQFARARQLLDPLLAAAPFDAQYLAAMAATYAQAGDDAGLRDFYRAKIDAMKLAPLAADDRLERIAGLRRGLIPALERLGDRAGAVDQYIEVINRYPEDQGLIREAAGYAAAGSLAPRLIAYYTKASADSAKDYRWPMVLARLETHAENFDAAIAAYTRAIGVRPDRTDLYLSRGALEERLMRFAEAEKTYRKVWDLSYRDPQWLEKVAELDARQGKTGDAVAALRQAWLDARPERPDTLMAVARSLESWGMIEHALGFAQNAAAGKLDDSDVGAYARLLTRVRRYQDVLAGYTERPNALVAMAEAVGEFYTPEEKVAFAAELAKHVSSPPNQLCIHLASRAGLRDLEARWRTERLQAPEVRAYEDYQLQELQNSRLRLEELGRQMEEIAAARRDENARSMALANARAAYHAAGDLAGLTRLFALDPRDPVYLHSLARRDPARLIQLAAGRSDAADVAMASGDVKLALEAIAAHGAHRPPVWTSAYTGLAGLYYWRTAPDVAGSFRAALGPSVIGERLGKTVDHDRQLAGTIWFYYGSRFGEYLALRNAGGAEDYLPAMVESRAGDARAYAEFADWFVERNDPRRALAEYQHSLELDADQGGVQDRIALVLWKDGRRDDAVAHWKSSLAAFEAQQGRPNLQENFWIEAPQALDHIGERGLAPQVRKEIDSLLASYEKRHEGYRLDPLFEHAAKYGAVDVTAQPEFVLERFADAQWLSAGVRIAMLRRLVALREQNPPPVEAQPAGWERPMTNEEQHEYLSWRQRQVYQWRVRLGDLLLGEGDRKGARQELDAVPDWARLQLPPAVQLELAIAAKDGTLDALLAGYRRDPKKAPGADALRNAAIALRNRKDETAARRILEFAYSRELDRGNFDSSNFLGLAEVRLESGDIAKAVGLLRRMQLISGEPFQNLLPAADLLERFHRAGEAQEFLRARVSAVPWDYAARVRLGNGLEAVVTDAKAPYRERVNAARRGAKGGSGELALVARGNIVAAEASQPYYYDARLLAATGTRDAATRLRLLLDAVAIRPEERTPLVPLLGAALDAHRDRPAETISQRSGVPAEMVSELAAACARIGDDGQALQILHRAIRGTATTAQRESWQRELTAIDQRYTLEIKNGQRRPIVADGLEQSRVVRPRIEP